MITTKVLIALLLGALLFWILSIIPASSNTGSTAALDVNDGRTDLSHFVPDQDTLLAFEVWLDDSPGHLLLIDPRGRKTGFDTSRGAITKEIPSAIYNLSNAMDPDALPDVTTSFYVTQPTEGNYWLSVIGTDAGYYLLSILSYSLKEVEQKGWFSSKYFVNIPIAKGQIHKYEFTFTHSNGCREVRGGLYGGGGESTDVDQFLTYSYPSDNETTLPAGTTMLPLQIFYGTIYLRSFQAKLNGADVSYLFNAIPGENQIVRINLAKGRNVLVLSVTGQVSGKTSFKPDIDTLVFRVP